VLNWAHAVDKKSNELSNTAFAWIDHLLLSVGRLPNLTHLRYFLAVGECLSFREAATRLNVAQPAVTRAIQLLESEVGYPLLERTTRRVAFTAAGQHLFTEATLALGHLAAAVRDAKQFELGTAGELVVAYSGLAAALAPSAAARFRRAYPEAAVVMYVRSSEESVAMLASGQLDLAFMLSAACQGEIRHRVLQRESFVVLMPKYHPLSGSAELPLKDLAGFPFVVGGQSRLSRLRVFGALLDSVCATAGFRPNVAEEANDAPMLMELVGLGRGITLYGSQITSALPPGVVAVPVADKAVGFDLSIAWSSRRETPLVLKFVELMASGELGGSSTGAASLPPYPVGVDDLAPPDLSVPPKYNA
jgi:DNA-binding transcriptional LysR family regulator